MRGWGRCRGGVRTAGQGTPMGREVPCQQALGAAGRVAPRLATHTARSGRHHHRGGRALHRRMEVRQPGLGEQWCSIWLDLAAATASSGAVQVAAGEHCVAGLRRVQGRRDGPVRLPSLPLTRRLVVFIVAVGSGVLCEGFV